MGKYRLSQRECLWINDTIAGELLLIFLFRIFEVPHDCVAAHKLRQIGYWLKRFIVHTVLFLEAFAVDSHGLNTREAMRGTNPPWQPSHCRSDQHSPHCQRSSFKRLAPFPKGHGHLRVLYGRISIHCAIWSSRGLSLAVTRYRYNRSHKPPRFLSEVCKWMCAMLREWIFKGSNGPFHKRAVADLRVYHLFFDVADPLISALQEHRDDDCSTSSTSIIGG